MKCDGIAGEEFCAAAVGARPGSCTARELGKPAQLDARLGPSTPELQIEAMEFASNSILKAALNNARALQPGEDAAYAGDDGAAWQSTTDRLRGSSRRRAI